MTRLAPMFLFSLGISMPALAQTSLAPPVVVTQGEAIVRRAPDRAWLTVATETRDARSAEARRKNADAMTAVQNALRSAGIRADAIRTTGLSVSPEMDWNDGRSVLRGYVARNQVEIRIDDLDKLSDVFDGITAARNVALSINGPRFDLKDERSAQNEALRLAVEAAMSRAQAIAAGAKRTLGEIVRIEEQGVGPIMAKPMQALRMSAAPADVATPIAPGEIEIHAQVSLTVQLR